MGYELKKYAIHKKTKIQGALKMVEVKIKIAVRILNANKQIGDGVLFVSRFESFRRGGQPE